MNIIELCDIKTKQDIVHEYTAEIKNNQTPLIIDNGSYQCRVGWSTGEAPLLIFRNLISKPRKDRRKEPVEAPNPPIQIGNDIVNIESLRLQLKTPFEQNVVTHFTHQEHIYDYIFSHLGIDADGCVPHPIVLTEAPANPSYCRQHMTELLFECYGVPGVCYGVDALFSFQRNFRDTVPDCMIISFGYTTTHVIPVLGGELLIEKTRRLDVGGYHVITYLFRLMQMKYPVHSNAITISRMEVLLQQHGHIAENYMEDVEEWAKADYYEKHVKIIQLPYAQPQPTVTSTLTEEQKFERRKEMTRRLLEANARRNKNSLEEAEQQLQLMEEILELHQAGNTTALKVALKEHGLENIKNVNKVVSVLKTRVERLRIKVQQPLDLENITVKEKVPVVPQPPAGVSIADWVNETKEKRAQLYERKQARKTRRMNLAKRRTAAAQERMRIISQLASKEKGSDDFGMHDSDWDVYKFISRDNDSDSENENEKLLEFEDILRHHDPTFKEPAQWSADAAENYQLHFGLEAIRTPELLFQPSMIGVPEMGLGELLEFVFNEFSDERKRRLASNVFLTGGCAQFQGLYERLDRELTEMLPYQMPHKLSFAKMPELDAWLGARDFARASNFSEFLTTKEDYEEKGSAFFKEHSASNFYYPEAAVTDAEDNPK